MPKLIFIPFLTYLAALVIIFILFLSASVIYTFCYFFITVLFYIFFYDQTQFGSLLNILFTWTAGTWTYYGAIYPGSTIYSTSAMTQVAAVAISALKLLAVLLKNKFPIVSAFWALTNAKSPKIDYY